MKKFVAVVGVAAVVSLAAAGCSPRGGGPSASGELGKVSTIEELRDAFVDAGGVCNWKQTDKVTDATASGECSDQTVLMLFADPADADAVVDRLTGLTAFEVSLLVGENWIINSPAAEEMVDEIGGEWVDGN